MKSQTLYQRYQRLRTIQTHRISSLPIVILMPHSACNCRCVMCDIWTGNNNLQQLSEKDITGLLSALTKYNTRQVLMSGGEALLNPNFFRFCEILKSRGMKISLLSTGIAVKRNAAKIVRYTDDIIVSLDGDEALHDAIRNIPGAFHKMKEGINAVREIDPSFSFTGRTVIHRLNFRQWPDIIKSAKTLGLDRVSFLPADLSSTAFNRALPWNEERQWEIALSEEDLGELKEITSRILTDYAAEIRNGFIAESPEKLQQIYRHYAAFHGLDDYPFKKCNAPWVSTVIEADGTVRPCFFLDGIGNIKTTPLNEILNSKAAVEFRKTLDINKNAVCVKCVCHLHLSPLTAFS